MKTIFQAVLILSVFILLLAVCATWHVERLAARARTDCAVITESCVSALTEVARWQLPLSDTWHQSGVLALAYIRTGEFAPAETERLLWDLKAALYGSRSLLRPESDTLRSQLLQDVEQSLAVPVSTLEIEGRSNARVRYGWQVLAQLCFWSWIVFVVLGMFRGVSKNGVLDVKRFLPYLLFGLAAFAGWLFCLTAA
jgi:hypothetical protein